MITKFVPSGVDAAGFDSDDEMFFDAIACGTVAVTVANAVPCAGATTGSNTRLRET